MRGRLGFLWLAALALASPVEAKLPVARARIVRVYPHDPSAFTEGLLWHGGSLYESTGLEGHSDIREVRLADGAVLQRRVTDPGLFGEGIVDWKHDLVSVTWRTQRGFRWDLATLRRKSAFAYPGEGWGLTRDSRNLILSDGTPVLRILDPVTFALRRTLTVTAEGQSVVNLNELEYVNGEILANIWMTDRIARIDPATGAVKGWIDITTLAADSGRRGPDDVANGIAWDARGKRLFVTGKNWPKLYEIRF
jgi:glutamine cyclotransferase